MQLHNLNIKDAGGNFGCLERPKVVKITEKHSGKLVVKGKASLLEDIESATLFCNAPDPINSANLLTTEDHEQDQTGEHDDWLEDVCPHHSPHPTLSLKQGGSYKMERQDCLKH